MLVTKHIESEADIKYPVTLAHFVTDQMDFAKSSYEKMMGNSRLIFENMTGYNAEVIKLLQ